MKSTDSYESIYLQLMDDMLPNRITGYSGYIVVIIPIIVVIYSVNTSLQYYSAIRTSTCHTIHIHQLLQLGFKEHQGTNFAGPQTPAMLMARQSMVLGSAPIQKVGQFSGIG